MHDQTLCPQVAQGLQFEPVIPEDPIMQDLLITLGILERQAVMGGLNLVHMAVEDVTVGLQH